jgi:hypothetical protein
MSAENENLRNYLFENLSAKEYSLLSETMDISETKLSRLLNGTDCWEIYTFTRLVKLLPTIDPHTLLKRFALKNNITVNEMDSIVKEYENK